MDYNPERLGEELVDQLRSRMNEQEDAQSAIAAYKMANYIISQLEEVKRTALQQAEHDLRVSRRDSIKTSAGSAGWTQPKVRVLNENAWREAVSRDPGLAEIQRNFEVSQAVLQNAQEPFMELPEPVFFIR